MNVLKSSQGFIPPPFYTASKIAITTIEQCDNPVPIADTASNMLNGYSLCNG